MKNAKTKTKLQPSILTPENENAILKIITKSFYYKDIRNEEYLNIKEELNEINPHHGNNKNIFMTSDGVDGVSKTVKQYNKLIKDLTPHIADIKERIAVEFDDDMCDWVFDFNKKPIIDNPGC